MVLYFIKLIATFKTISVFISSTAQRDLHKINNFVFIEW